MAINLANGLNITSPEPVDSRIIKSKTEMENIMPWDVAGMPDKYFCICSDDGKLYFFNKSAQPDPETGKVNYFKEMDDVIQESLDIGDISVPTASYSLEGVVKATTDKNGVDVDASGFMEVNDIGVEKLSNTENIILVLDGGSAPSAE